MNSYLSQDRTHNRLHTYTKEKHTSLGEAAPPYRIPVARFARWARLSHPIESQWLASLAGRGRAIKNTKINLITQQSTQRTLNKPHKNTSPTMATTLDLSNAVMHDAREYIHTFFINNTWTWGNYHEDQIILDAMHADFLPTLASLAVAINKVSDVRGALHIHLHNIEKANTPLLPLLTFHNSIIDQHHLFDGYNLYVFAHGDQGRDVNIGTLALSM